AMLAGVVFHAALAYSPLMHPLWPAADRGNSVAVDMVAWCLHMFRMPLFFAVAGYFAALLVARRGMAGLFRNRIARVLLPLVVFAPPILIGMGWLTERAASSVAHPSPALAWIRAYIEAHGAMPSMPGWAHLWFLFYLLLFTVLAWVVSTLELGRIGRRLAAMPPVVLVIGLPLAMTPALAMVGVPWPAPEFYLPSLWALLFFGLYFAFGYLLFHHGDLLDRLRPMSMLLLVGGIVAYALLFWLTRGFVPSQLPIGPRALHALLEASAGFWMTLFCLLAAKRWLDMRNAAMRWLADGSYWVYLAHLPILLAIQYPLLDVHLHWAAKFALSVAGTFLLSFASYQLLVRHTVLGRLLNGRRPG
ncbi:MAG: acyltransferase family protein, partial [Thermomonas sp.]